ncbi:MAG: hypothetical protein ACLU4J_16350 [Butyricimonas paravirosa]
MMNENGNGLPDDTWCELKGSASAEEMSRKYVITYYRPTRERELIWSDNYGTPAWMLTVITGRRSFPMFIEEDLCISNPLGSKVEWGGLW